jgi:hypothetical protein
MQTRTTPPAAITTEPPGRGEIGDEKMTAIHTSREIYAILQAAGPMYGGGNDGDRSSLADAWDEICTPDQVRRWIAAECWEPSAAQQLANAGFRPTVDTLRYLPGHERDDIDAMYAMCNSDVSLTRVCW